MGHPDDQTRDDLGQDPSAEADTLALEHELLLEFMYLCPFGVLQMDAVGDVVMVNPAVARMLLPVAPTMSIANLFETLQEVAPDLRSFVDAFADRQGTICEGRRINLGVDPKGVPRHLALTIIKLDDARWMVVVSDISREVAQELKLAQAHSWFAAMTAGVKDFGLLSVDGNGRVTSWDDSAAEQTGFEAKDILGRTLNMIYLPEDAIAGRALQQVELAGRDGWHIDEGWRKRKDGTRYWCQSLVTVATDGNPDRLAVVLRHVSARKRGLSEIKNRLTLDHLTGVFNRAHFFEIGEAQMARLAGVPGQVSALMIDADHFKAINDTFGHATGDRVLKDLASTIQRYLRPLDVVGRIGGEEFALMLPGLDIEGAKLVASSLRSQIALMRIHAEGELVQLTVSIGCAERDDSIVTLDQLLAAADRALYEAKTSGRNCIVTYPEWLAAEGARSRSASGAAEPTPLHARASETARRGTA